MTYRAALLLQYVSAAVLAVACSLSIAMSAGVLHSPNVPDVVDTQALSAMPPVSCTIRSTPEGVWYALDTGGHTPSNCATVTQTHDRINVYFGFTAGEVSSVGVMPDETMAKNDVRAGASVGFDHAEILMFKGTSAIPLDPATVYYPGSNWWLIGWMRTTAAPSRR